MRSLDGMTDSIDMSLGGLRESVMDRACCSPWGRKESDLTVRLNRTEPEGRLFCLLTAKYLLSLPGRMEFSLPDSPFVCP